MTSYKNHKLITVVNMKIIKRYSMVIFEILANYRNFSKTSKRAHPFKAINSINSKNTSAVQPTSISHEYIEKPEPLQ